MLERSTQSELLDQGAEHFEKAIYEDCLEKLGCVGRWLGGDRAVLKVLKNNHISPLSILDVGCGGGYLAMRLAAVYHQAEVLGVDIEPAAIGFAEKCHKNILKNLSFERQEGSILNFNRRFDLVVTNLVCHHMSDDEIVHFLKESTSIAGQAVIVSDLHRHHLAYWGFAAMAPLIFRNAIITHDGKISIKRAFRKNDWWRLIDKAGIDRHRCSLRWFWPFRWVLCVRC